MAKTLIGKFNIRSTGETARIAGILLRNPQKLVEICRIGSEYEVSAVDNFNCTPNHLFDFPATLHKINVALMVAQKRGGSYFLEQYRKRYRFYGRSLQD